MPKKKLPPKFISVTCANGPVIALGEDGVLYQLQREVYEVERGIIPVDNPKWKPILHEVE